MQPLPSLPSPFSSRSPMMNRNDISSSIVYTESVDNEDPSMSSRKRKSMSQQHNHRRRRTPLSPIPAQNRNHMNSGGSLSSTPKMTPGGGSVQKQQMKKHKRNSSHHSIKSFASVSATAPLSADYSNQRSEVDTSISSNQQNENEEKELLAVSSSSAQIKEKSSNTTALSFASPPPSYPVVSNNNAIIKKLTFSFLSTNSDGTMNHKLNPKSLRYAYNNALQHGIHQRTLKESGCNLLSIDEVILATMVSDKMKSLRRFIGKARGYNDIETVHQLQFTRAIVASCQQNASIALQQYRIEKGKEREEGRQKAIQVQEELRQIEKQRLKEEKKKEKRDQLMKLKMESEMKKRDRKKHCVKNKELWREVAVLMTNLAQMEKEDKMWRSIDVESMTTIRDSDTSDDQSLMEKDEGVMIQKDHKQQHRGVHDYANEVQSSVKNVAEDVILAANRINNTLTTISDCILESDKVRTELYQKYKDDHKFHGYFGVKDPKALIRCLMFN